MKMPSYVKTRPLVHIQIKNGCLHFEAQVRAWARDLGVAPGLVVWGSGRGPKETPVRVVVDRCDRLRRGQERLRGLGLTH